MQTLNWSLITLTNNLWLSNSIEHHLHTARLFSQKKELDKATVQMLTALQLIYVIMFWWNSLKWCWNYNLQVGSMVDTSPVNSSWKIIHLLLQLCKTSVMSPSTWSQIYIYIYCQKSHPLNLLTFSSLFLGEKEI